MSNSEVQCPECQRMWPVPSEQALAVQKRGKCIACIVNIGERIEMNPYEFALEVVKTVEALGGDDAK